MRILLSSAGQSSIIAELNFYEVAVFGSVSGALMARLAVDVVCPSAALPVPYYARSTDPLWRFGELDAPRARRRRRAAAA